MRGYGQYCGLAKALDIVGDRWTLLVVRELLSGPARYRDLLAGLPGVATNLLAQRLRGLEEFGVIEREISADGVPVYALTELGDGLREPVEALVRWGAPLLGARQSGDTFRAPWLALALRALLVGRRSGEFTRVALEVEGETVEVHADPSGVHIGLGVSGPAEAYLRTDADTALALASRTGTVREAIGTAQHFEGSARALDTVFGRHRDTEPTLLYVIKQVELVVRARLDELLQPEGITVLQYTALTVLERHADLSTAELARNSFVTTQTMAGMVAALEARRLISRRQDPSNRRRLMLRVTETGKALLDRCRGAVAALENTMVDGLTGWQARELRAYLYRCRAELSSRPAH